MNDGGRLGFLVGRVDEFPANSRRIVRVGGREIGVFRVDDRFYAVRNRCPHQGGPLCAGRVYQRAIADAPGAVRLDEQMLLACPWHGWQYDMKTGQSYVPGDPHVRSYGVSVQRGAVLGQGEYVAETFDVFVDEDYVVLDA